MNKEVHEVFEEYLLRRDLKYTAQRRAVVDVLFEYYRHVEGDPFIDQLHSKGYKVSRGTVYSTLKLLVDSRLVRKLKTIDNKVHYEPTYGKDHHDHLICTDCGKIFEFHNDQIESIQESVSASFGLQITNHSHTIYGLCLKSNCPEKKIK